MVPVDDYKNRRIELEKMKYLGKMEKMEKRKESATIWRRWNCLIDSPSIIQSRKQSQRPMKKDDFYFKILSWTVKKPKGKKEEQKQRRCLPHRPLTIHPRSLSLRQRDSLFLEQARRYQDKILAEAEKEEEKEERTATITSLDEQLSFGAPFSEPDTILFKSNKQLNWDQRIKGLDLPPSVLCSTKESALPSSALNGHPRERATSIERNFFVARTLPTRDK
ncbi:hypothetical protein Tco_1348507, partial [Tanacetum coccineum]